MPFVSFEGVDGSGKTTQLGRLADWLETLGHIVVRTKEPDGGGLGAAVRAILTRARDIPLAAVEELLLVAAARHDHVRSVIRPALAAGKWVLTDRFVDSSFALQVHGGGASIELFRAVTAAVAGSTLPDLTIILDLDPDRALERRMGRTGPQFDPAELTRDFKQIRDGFQFLASAEPRRCRLIEADQEPDAVTRDIQDELRALALPPSA